MLLHGGGLGEVYGSVDCPENISGLDLWALPMDGSRKPFAVARSPFNEQSGQFSPDSNWIAYESNESGRGEIYVQSFPAADHKMPVSTGGGT
jgi:Tol biopolymer transport system component